MFSVKIFYHLFEGFPEAFMQQWNKELHLAEALWICNIVIPLTIFTNSCDFQMGNSEYIKSNLKIEYKT